MQVDISDTDYAARTQHLLKLARSLRQVGAHTIIDIPRICVIGSQSAGKSSLVEAVSGIQVPRDSGTCTRCPVECSMTKAQGAWSCKISLRFDYDNHGNAIGHRTVDFGHPLTSKAEVELMLRRAQAAILNPDVNPQNFLTKSVDELQYYRSAEAFGRGTLRFSRNAVCVDIQDPAAADLSFIDLPGLIQNETPEMVKVVEDLVRDNIRGNECLILVTMPMSDDIENQRAMRLAKEADPAHTHTIGVLTKPDTLTAGATNAREQWKNIIEGGSHPLTHGYYCVKLPDDDERAKKLSRTEADQLAMTFFRQTPFYNSFLNRGRVGIRSLVTDLSKLLTTIIDQGLPKIRSEVDEKLKESRLGLSKLPTPVKLEDSEVLTRITDFCNELRAMFYGHGGLKSYIQENRATYDLLRRNIRLTAPDFMPFLDSSKYESLDKELDSTRRLTFDLPAVRQVVKNSIAWELPRNVPFDASAELIHKFLNHWDAPVLACYDEVSRRLEANLRRCLHKFFERFPVLRDQVTAHVMTHFASLKDQTLQDVGKIIKFEKTPIFTQNLPYLDSARERWLSCYREARRTPNLFLKPQTARKKSISVCLDEDALDALAEVGYTNITASDLSRLSPPDEFEEELQVMANVRAYFEVAHKRIIDYVPLAIEHSLHQALVDELYSGIVRKLDITSGGRDLLRRLLSENSAIARQRHWYEDRIKKLEAAAEELLSISEQPEEKDFDFDVMSHISSSECDQGTSDDLAEDVVLARSRAITEAKPYEAETSVASPDHHHSESIAGNPDEWMLSSSPATPERLLSPDRGGRL